MQERSVPKGTQVITQGEKGEEILLVYKGQLSCFKSNDKGTEQQFIMKYESGDIFGELALLYNAPRAATIIADTDSVLYSLDRTSFNYIVKDSIINKRNNFFNFLS